LEQNNQNVKTFNHCGQPPLMNGSLPSRRQKVGFQSNDFKPQRQPWSPSKCHSSPNDYRLPKLADTRCVNIRTNIGGMPCSSCFYFIYFYSFRRSDNGRIIIIIDIPSWD